MIVTRTGETTQFAEAFLNLTIEGAPEIGVSSSAGGAVASGGTDAQGALPAAMPVTVTCTVTNSGSAPLSLATATTASLSNVVVGSITSPGSTSFPRSGGSTTFQVGFAPAGAGASSFVLQPSNGDSDENPCLITVSGTGIAWPSISAVSPNSGTTGGGTAVTISGGDFTGATAVRFGSTVVPASGFTSASDTQIVVNAPAGSAGTVRVAVVTPGGTTANVAADDFTYVAPVVEVRRFTINTEITAGAPNTYRVDVIPRDASINGTVTLTMTLPVEVSLRSVVLLHGWTCSNAGQVVTCTVDTPLPQDSVNATIVRVNSPMSGTVPGFDFTVSGGGAATSATGTFPGVDRISLRPSPTVVQSSLTLTVGETMTPVTPATFTGGTPDFLWLITPPLPQGLTFSSSTGTISGTPTVAEAERDDTLGVMDNFAVTATGTIRLATVAPVLPTLTLDATAPSGDRTATIAFDIVAPPGSAAGGADASGTLTLAASFTGMPLVPTAASGTGWSCGIAAHEVTCTSTAPIVAGSPGNPVTITVMPDSAAVSAQPSFTLSGGGTAPFTWSVSPDLPAGLTMDPATGQVTGTPTVCTPTQSHTFTLTNARGAVCASSAKIGVGELPAVSGLDPIGGSVDGGTAVTITGSQLTGMTAVHFGATQASSCQFVSDTEIRAIAPAGTGAVAVPVTNPIGTNLFGPSFAYGVAPGAAVSAVDASAGYTATSTATSDAAGVHFNEETAAYLGASGTDTTATVGGMTFTPRPDGFVEGAWPAGLRGTSTAILRGVNAFGAASVPFAVTLGDPVLSVSLTVSGAEQGTPLRAMRSRRRAGSRPTVART